MQRPLLAALRSIVLIEHPPHIASLYNLPYLATQYAHLNDIVVREGQVGSWGQETWFLSGWSVGWVAKAISSASGASYG